MRGRLTCTARGRAALGLAPPCALAGVLAGAEELVLLAIALAVVLAGGALVCTRRARTTAGRWRIQVARPDADAQVGRDQLVTVHVVPVDHQGSGIGVRTGRTRPPPIWIEDPRLCWRRATRGAAPGATTDQRAATGDGASPFRPRPRLSAAIELRPRSAPAPGGAGGGAPGGLDADTPTSLTVPVPTEHRGVYVLEGLRLWCFDGLGLFARQVGSGPSAVVSVLPSPREVALTDELARAELGPEDTTQRLVPAARRDDFGDFTGLRPYVPGDRLRHLYWPALARTGELFVRDFEDTSPRRVHVVVDVRPLIGFRGTEAVLAVAAGVGLRALAEGATVELSTSSGEQIAVGPGPYAETALLRAIAGIESTLPPEEHGRGRAGAPGPDSALHNFVTYRGAPLVVTTEGGAGALPAAFGFSDLILAA